MSGWRLEKKRKKKAVKALGVAATKAMDLSVQIGANNAFPDCPGFPNCKGHLKILRKFPTG